MIKLVSGEMVEFERVKRKKFIGIMNGKKCDILIDLIYKIEKGVIKTKLNDLKVGTSFFVKDGYYVGEIVLVNGQKKMKEQLSQQIYDLPDEKMEICLRSDFV